MDTSALMIYQDKGVADQIVGKLAGAPSRRQVDGEADAAGLSDFPGGKGFQPGRDAGQRRSMPVSGLRPES